MSNIYLKVTIEKKWRIQNLDFKNLKSLSPGQFLACTTHAGIIKFSNFLLQLKNTSKTVCGFCSIFIFKGKSAWFLLNKSIKFNKKRRNAKWKTPNAVSERWTMYFSSYKNCKLKIIPWWVGGPERKKECICCMFFSSEDNFFNICCILSQCKVYWKNFHNIYILIHIKNITSYTFVAYF